MFISNKIIQRLFMRNLTALVLTMLTFTWLMFFKSKSYQLACSAHINYRISILESYLILFELFIIC